MGNAIRMSRNWGGVYRTPFTFDADRLRDVGRLALKAVILIAFLYTSSIGWDLLQDLREVKLYQLRQVFRVASVGDVLLLWAAYALFREFARAMGRRKELPRS